MVFIILNKYCIYTLSKFVCRVAGDIWFESVSKMTDFLSRIFDY